MKKYLCLAFLLSAFVFSHSIDAAVRGRVVDGSNNPVVDAMVIYSNLDNRLICTYTCSDGRFSIPAPAEWSITNPQINTCNTDIRNKPQNNKIRVSSIPNLTVEGGLVRFYSTGTERVTMTLLSSNGRKIHTAFDGTVSLGVHHMDPFYSFRRSLSHQIYIVQTTVGSVSRSFAMLYSGTPSRSATTFDIQETAASLQKAAAAVDTIRAGKTNYTAGKKAVDSYDVDIGDITITKRDVEAEVTALMNGKSKDWKTAMCTQCVDYAYSGNYGTVFYGAGNEPTADQSDSWQTSSKTNTGIGKMVGMDVIRGFQGPPGGTYFPHNIGMGCTGKTDLIELEERIAAIEARSKGVNWVFAPCIDVPRHEGYGRTYEGWDEGPDGTKICARAAVRGFQGTDLSCDYCVASTAKHFAGEGGDANGTTATDCNTGTNEVLASIHLPGFKAAVDNGVATVMVGMQAWLGTKMHVNKMLMTDTLKTRWNWDGFIVGDWAAASNAPGGVTAAINAGLDNPMEPTAVAATQVAIGNADAARIDDACKRILRIKFRLNLANDWLSKRYLAPTWGSPLHKQVAREAVRRSVVLLKNDDVSAGKKALPIDVNANVHIIGSFADNMWMQCGGWTLGWPWGLQNQPVHSTPPAGQTLKAAITSACKGQVTYSTTASGIPAAANVIVVCVGEVPYAEGGGDAPGSQPFTLTSEHKGLISTAKASGKPVVVVMYSGRPLIIADDLANCTAWLQAWLPGTEGNGIADILFSINGEKPTGKLSHTWPKTVQQIPVNYPNPTTNAPYGDVTGSDKTDPLFPYKYGLTY
jgi:beta-glucosidase